MDNTVAIALITAFAGIAGALTSAAVSSMTAARQDRRLDAREARKWRRELAEKDRERLYQLFEQIVALHRQLHDTLGELLDQPAPQTRAQQAGGRQTANELVLLSARASVLGATDVSSAPIATLFRDITDRLRSGPIEGADREKFFSDYNKEATVVRAAMRDNLRRLRSEE